MTMRLATLKITPRGPGGWESDTLVFGQRMTELYGPNGCGKTPLLTAIAHALGSHVTFRDDIVHNCEAVTLTLDTDQGPAAITRLLQPSFDSTIKWGKEEKTFFSERDFTQFMFDKCGLAMPDLTSVGDEPVQPYMATLLPLFFLDQDTSYTNVYKASKSFIRDQYGEMVRIIFGLEPKHSFNRKKRQIERKNRLETLDKQIVNARESLEGLAKERTAERRPLQVIESDIQVVSEKLNELRKARNIHRDASSSLEPLIDQKQREVLRLDRSVAEIVSRIDGFARMESDIESEIATLALNEQARNVFSSFSEICGQPGCGLFLGAAESYGKNLLYLRDQVKDLRVSNSVNEGRLAALRETRAVLVKEIRELSERQTALDTVDEANSLVTAVAELTERLFVLQREKSLEAELNTQETEYVKLLNERTRIQDELAMLGGQGPSEDLRALELRMQWRDLIGHWLDVLQTKNVSRDVEIDTDFNVLFGKEKVNQFKGSTLVRVVLAIRTACFQLYAREATSKIGFFILDTPRQQDIERESLSSYISALRDVATMHKFQVVFSTTDYHYDGSAGDVEWRPKFPGPEQDMFLRRGADAVSGKP